MSDTGSGFTYEPNLNGLCERITYILGDAEKGYPNTTWEKPFLLALACDALFMLASVKPDLFKADRVRVPLTPETWKQSVDCDVCELMLSIVCFETESGSTIPAIEQDYKTVQRAALLPAPCRGCSGGVMNMVPSIQVGMDNKSLGDFGITPMFPADEKLYAIVRCRNLRQYYDGTSELPEGLRGMFPAIIQLVLHLALAGDRAEGGLAALSNQHFTNFTQLAALTMQQESFLRRQLSGETS